LEETSPVVTIKRNFQKRKLKECAKSKEIYMSNVIFNIAKQAIGSEKLDLNNDTISILLTFGYTPDVSNHEYVSDIVSSEISGTNYIRQDLSAAELVEDNVNNRSTFSASNVTWPQAVFSADGAIIYKRSGEGILVADDSNYMLIAYLDFGIIKSSNNTDFIIEWSEAEGIFQIR
jgi:hypothetical protein